MIWSASMVPPKPELDWSERCTTRGTRALDSSEKVCSSSAHWLSNIIIKLEKVSPKYVHAIIQNNYFVTTFLLTKTLSPGVDSALAEEGMGCTHVLAKAPSGKLDQRNAQLWPMVTEFLWHDSRVKSQVWREAQRVWRRCQSAEIEHLWITYIATMEICKNAKDLHFVTSTHQVVITLPDGRYVCKSKTASTLHSLWRCWVGQVVTTSQKDDSPDSCAAQSC